MKFQLTIILLTALAFLLANRANGNGLAYAIAQPLTVRNMANSLYERARIVFEKSLEDVEKTINEGLSGIKNQVKQWKKELEDADSKKASQDDLDTIKKDQTDKLKKMQDGLDEVILKLDKTPEPKEEKNQAKSFMNLAEDAILKMKTGLKEKGLSLKDLWNDAKSTSRNIDIDLKAVSNMTEGYSLTGPNSNLLRGMLMEPGVAKDPTTPLFVTDLIQVGAISEPTVYWTERQLLEGGAAQTAEAARFAQISAKYIKLTVSAKKTAAYMKVTEEAVEDIDFMLTEMQDELISGPASIRVLLENQILTGDGTGENHKGLFTLATAFAVPTGFQTLANPNNFDAAQAAMLQIAKANFMCDYMLVNPSDLINMKLTKDANGNYIIPPFMQSEAQIGSMKVVANNRIAEGAFLMGDMKRAKLFINRSLTIKFFDQNEDDAVNDLRTITGSTRGVFRVKGPDTKAFVKGTFNAVKNAIKTV